MKLNQRDKLILVVVLVVLIWVAGIMLLIKPGIESYKSATTELDQKQVDLAAKQKQIKDDETLPQDVDNAYNLAVETSEVFYPRMPQHEAATTLQTLFDVNNDGEQEINNLNLGISGLIENNLQRYIYTPESVETTLDTIIDQMNGITEPTDEDNVAVSSTITAYEFSFEFMASEEDVLTFMENLMNSTHKSLVINACDISQTNGSSTTEGETASEGQWSGSVELCMLMVPELPTPEEVNSAPTAPAVDAESSSAAE